MFGRRRRRQRLALQPVARAASCAASCAASREASGAGHNGAALIDGLERPREQGLRTIEFTTVTPQDF